MSHIAISNFPPDFNQKKLLPEFAKRGLSEIEILTTNQATRRFSQRRVSCDRVFMLIDNCAHSEFYKLQSLLKEQDIPLVTLTRKSASWPSQFFPVREDPKESDMSWNRTASVREENIESMLREYMELRKSGSSPASMVAALSKYWTGRKLENVTQVRNLVYRLTSSGKAPQFFVDYWNSLETATVVETETVVEQFPETPADFEVLKSTKEEPPKKTEEKSCEEWVSLLEEDNERLREQIRVLQSKVQEAKVLKTSETPSLSELFDLLGRCVKFGIMNENEVVTKIKRVLTAGG